ncbi:aldo/keto reductase [Martelella soudanensis]|uniref:aldo/keto reductase n=1 Tax=unclassified Martelella TaxID=2629616 RepID=UPI0015DE9635|nr:MULTISPECIES: aldo/keto reductase [unclassified Martelella]
MTMNTINGIPQMGFGTWKRTGNEAYEMVKAALEAGYRHIDTAQAYDNESQVGNAISDSSFTPADIFVTTKVWIDNYGPGAFRPSVEESMARLRLDKLDLLLLHWPGRPDGPAFEDYIGELAAVYDEGLTKRIGVSNFNTALLAEAARLLGDRKISTNQVECHVFNQNGIVADYCREHDIALTAYSPLAQGKIVGNPILKEVANAHETGEGEIALAFLMAEGHVVIPTSSRPERVKSNLDAAAIRLSGEEVVRIRELDAGMRMIDPEWAPDWD